MKSVLAVCAVIVMIVGFEHVGARPNNRIKRVSDSHLADLETKLAMNNRIKGFAITLPVGGGKIDPYQIGRRRRSDPMLVNPIFDQAPTEEDIAAAYNYLLNAYLYNNYIQ